MPAPPTSLTRTIGALALLLSLSASSAIAIEDSVDREILAGDWEGVYLTISSDSAKAADPALRILLGYACRFTNRLGDSDDWWEQVRAGTVDTQWASWTASFLERHPGTAAGLYFASRGASIEDRDDEARKLLNAACKADKNFAPAFWTRCADRNWAGQDKKAKSDCDQALETWPSFVLGRLLRATVLRNLGKPEQAIEDYSLAIAEAPEHPAAYKHRGNVYFHREQWDAAIADYSTVIDRALSSADDSRDPDLAMLYNNRATAYKSKGAVAEALSDYASVIALEGTAADDTLARAYAHQNRGDLLMEQDRWREAFEDYSASIALAPDFATPYAFRGLIYINKMDDRDHGCADLKRACDLGYCKNYMWAKSKKLCK